MVAAVLVIGGLGGLCLDCLVGVCLPSPKSGMERKVRVMGDGILGDTSREV